MQTIGLALLVKDEATRLPRMLPSLRGVIDAWTVLDTGSTDGTPEIVQETLADLPGRVLHGEFDGFGPARTRLLAHAREQATDYTLMLDADHTLKVRGERPVALDADAYLLKIEGALEWRLPLLTRTAHPFEYRGVAHAYLATTAPSRIERLDWLAIDGGKGASRAKLERDRVLLETEHATHPGDPRTIFYLAQTYRDLGLVEQAIEMYRLRADVEHGGYAEERYYARYQLGCLLCEHIAFAQGARELLRAWRERPQRAEALRALAHAANAVADKLPPPGDDLFVTPSAYGRTDA